MLRDGSRPAFRLFVCLCLLAAAGPARGTPRTTLTVFAAASLSDAFRELGRKFESAHPATRVEFNFAGSQQLALQVEHGAAADVLASADERWMEHVAARALAAGPPREFARNQIVVVLPRANPARLHALADLARKGLKIVAGAPAVPVGAYSREVIRKLGRSRGFPAGYERRVAANIASEEENVKQVLAKVQLGEADAGFVYISDVTPAISRQVRVLLVPENCNVTARYPIVRLRAARNAALADAFIGLVLSPEGQEILEDSGFLPGVADID